MDLTYIFTFFYIQLFIYSFFLLIFLLSSFSSFLVFSLKTFILSHFFFLLMLYIHFILDFLLSPYFFYLRCSSFSLHYSPSLSFLSPSQLSPYTILLSLSSPPQCSPSTIFLLSSSFLSSVFFSQYSPILSFLHTFSVFSLLFVFLIPLLLTFFSSTIYRLSSFFPSPFSPLSPPSQFSSSILRVCFLPSSNVPLPLFFVSSFFLSSQLSPYIIPFLSSLLNS